MVDTFSAELKCDFIGGNSRLTTSLYIEFPVLDQYNRSSVYEALDPGTLSLEPAQSVDEEGPNK